MVKALCYRSEGHVIYFQTFHGMIFEEDSKPLGQMYPASIVKETKRAYAMDEGVVLYYVY